MKSLGGNATRRGGESESDSEDCTQHLASPNGPSSYLRKLLKTARESKDISELRRVLFGRQKGTNVPRQGGNQPGGGWNAENENSEYRGTCTCGMSDLPGQHTTFGCIPRKGHPWVSPELDMEEDSEASGEEGEIHHYYEIMSSVMQQKNLEAITVDMERGRTEPKGGEDVVDSDTRQTLAPEPAQGDATPAVETPVAALPSIYLVMPKEQKQATSPVDVRQLRRSLVAWTRQAIAVCITILTAGLVLMMLAITLIAREECEAVKGPKIP